MFCCYSPASAWPGCRLREGWSWLLVSPGVVGSGGSHPCPRLAAHWHIQWVSLQLTPSLGSQYVREQRFKNPWASLAMDSGGQPMGRGDAWLYFPSVWWVVRRKNPTALRPKHLLSVPLPSPLEVCTFSLNIFVPGEVLLSVACGTVSSSFQPS